MEKVKNVWWATKEESTGTGLVLELENGAFLQHQSTDPVMPFGVLKASTPKEDLTK